MAGSDPVVSLDGVERDYHSLRPLRIRHFSLQAAESVAILGLDQAAAEVLVNLITAATLPDSGRIRIFGNETSSIGDADSWMRALDDFGILSDRVVLLEEMTAEQNLTLPLSLELDAADEPIRARVRSIADEVGLGAAALGRAVASLPPLARLQVRLGKALAANPRVLLAEHPNATIPTDEAAGFARRLSEIISRRAIAALILTADRAFARAVAQRVLTHQPATGELTATGGWRGWFRG
jgi:ABC-type lipoprotein export system ATPase subunit